MAQLPKFIVSFVCLALAFFPLTVLSGVLTEPSAAIQPQQQILTANVKDATLLAPPFSDKDEQTPKAFAFITDYLANSTKTPDVRAVDYAHELVSIFDTALASVQNVQNVQRLWFTIFWTAMQLPAQSEDQQRLLDLVLATRNASAYGGAGRAHAERYDGYRFWWDFPFWREAFSNVEVASPDTPQVDSQAGRWNMMRGMSLQTPNETLTVERWAKVNGFLARMNGNRTWDQDQSMLTRGLWWLAENLEVHQDPECLEHTLTTTGLWLTTSGRMLKSQLLHGAFKSDYRDLSLRGLHFLNTDVSDDSESSLVSEQFGFGSGAWFERHGIPKVGHGSYRGSAILDNSRWKYWKNALKDMGERNDLSQEAMNLAAGAFHAMEKLDRCDAGLTKDCEQYVPYGM